MKFVHRIGLRATVSQRHQLEVLGVKLPAGVTLPGGGDPLLAFDIGEEHPNWATIATLLQEWRASDLVRTVFSKTEIQAAHWLELSAWHYGYPQPDEDVYGYRQVTYDLTNWCEQCGIGMKQNAPFQMKGEPKWGGHSILQLIWVYDEIFVTPRLWSDVFSRYSINCRPVLNTKGDVIKNIVQLVIEELIDVVTERLPSERCARCGRVKYLPITHGAFPPLGDVPHAAMVKTCQFFGNGSQANMCVLVSKDIARAVATVRGATLKPVQSSQ